MAGNGLVEESYICKLLEGGSLDTLKESGLRDEMFLTCKDQIQFIQKHEAEYKQLPDKMIFLQKFKDFQMLEVTESMDYLADRIKEQFLYTKLVPIVQEGGNLLREDSLKAYDYLRAALETLQKDNPVSKNREGVDIISSAKDRFRDLEETYYLTVYQVDDFEKAGERKSIPVEFCRENGIRIPSEKKRTLYRYDLSSWLKRYELSVEVR